MYGTYDKPAWKPILRWYFSPYLTTLLTAPAFLVLGYVIVLAVIRLVFQTFVFYLSISFMLGGFLAWPLIITIGAGLYAIPTLPMIWAKKDINGLVRVLLIVLCVVGMVALSTVAELIQNFLFIRAGLI